MNRERLFQKNLSLWAKSFPKEAIMLPYVDSRLHTFCQTKRGELNLKKSVVEGEERYYHSNEGAQQEAEEWFSHLNLQTSVLYVFGVGLGYYYEAIKPWLKKGRKRYLVFLENDLAVIHRLFETELGTRILQDPQVKLIYFRDLKDEEAAFEVLYWNFVMTRLTVSALHFYAETKADLLAELRHKIAYDAAVKNALVDEYLRFGGAFFINFYKNMLHLSESYYGNHFFGKFVNVPAIICGAGPSLEKNISMLKNLLDRAVVFAGGSSLNVLNAHFFQPHFGAGIDPNPMQFARMSTNQGYEVPFFYRNRMFHDAFKLIHGPRLYITGCGGYDIAEYFEEKFNIEAGFLDEGHNVVNFCVEVAHAMGCNPIIFVGMDLAFTGMKAYAPGVVEEESISQAEILDTEDYDAKALLRQDIFGQPTYTLWKWIAEAEWIGDFAKAHPFLTMINSTEGGLGFPGVVNQPLADAAERHLKRSFELNNRVHGETQNSAMPHITYQKVASTMKKLAESLKRTRHYLDILIEETEKVAQKIKQGETDFRHVQTGQAALAETELAEEEGYKHVVEIFNEVQSRILSQELHRLNISKSSEKQKTLKRLALNVKRLKFLRNVTQVNDELIDYAFNERKKQKNAQREKVEVPPPEKGTYTFENQILRIIDSEFGLHFKQPFAPVLVPKKERKDGLKLSDGCILKVFFNDSWTIQECYVEKNGQPHGQCLLLYPNGALKEEVFYVHGKLHGPSTFWSEDGKVLAKSWFIDGKQEGKVWWYYPSGSFYSLQRYKNGVWEGRQEYYDEEGNIKTLLNYRAGKLIDKPILLCHH